MIAMVHIAKARLGMDDETYRAWLEKKTGKRSSSALSDGQLGQLVKALRAEGLLDEPPTAAKVIAGKGANRPTDAQWKTARGLAKKIGLDGGLDGEAFAGFVKRIVKVDNPRFLTKASMVDVLIGLEKWWEDREQKKATATETKGRKAVSKGE
ncbi:MAG: regulatory protein GemA [Zoogloea sp.]|uniref:regulatory protein GemA n=1 Tax=Zoogloea sp. TaxID=49181 RepID=UPI0026345621|nr:regulatory protein GemA [Zoogloea sp.]MDD3325651.1 regulatory protein GemA [Zoogloea sp.]